MNVCRQCLTQKSLFKFERFICTLRCFDTKYTILFLGRVEVVLISEKVMTFHTILGEFLVHAGTAKVTKLSPASIHARTQAESA